MPLDTLENLLTHELSDLLSAEKQIAKLLERVAKAADSDTVKQMAQEHHAQTLQQAENLQRAFVALGKKPERITCKGAQGLVEETTSTLKEEKPQGAIKDLVLISGGLRVEHYEIAGYTSAIALAKAVGNKEVVALLTENLKQEQETAKKLLVAAPQFGAAAKSAPAPEAKPVKAASKGGRKGAKTGGE
jgi:ferritin-like metal-binding protein YciE